MERTEQPGGRLRGVRRGILLVARAGRWWFVATVATMALSGLGLGAAVLVGGEIARRLTVGGAPGTDLVPLLVAVVLLVAVIAFGQLVGTGLHRLLVEQVIYVSHQQVLRSSAYSEAIEFDRAQFHDELRRAKNSADSSLQLAMAVPQLLGSRSRRRSGWSGAAALTVPAMIPIVALSGIPLLLVSRANSDEMYSFSFGRHPAIGNGFSWRPCCPRGIRRPRSGSSASSPIWSAAGQSLYDERIAGLDHPGPPLRPAFGARRRRGGWHLPPGPRPRLVDGQLRRRDPGRHRGRRRHRPAARRPGAADRRPTSGQLSEHGLRLADYERLLAATTARQAVHRDPAGPLRRLVVDRLGFRYPGGTDRAVDDVSFTVEAGELVAIVGLNGSGKTTLAKLLCGLYRPDEGSVTWNGRPVHDLDLRGEVGAIFQTFARYWFSAADNIAIGDVARGTTVEPAAVRRAAELAGADEFLGSLRDGYDTRLTVELEGGTDLSLGQWQRVAIARVLYRDPSLVVLDEPTASLDPQAEAALFATLDDLRRDRTIVMISHRFSSVRSADRILVVDQGRLIEHGTHDQLLELDGHYAKLYRTQAAAFVTAP